MAYMDPLDALDEHCPACGALIFDERCRACGHVLELPDVRRPTDGDDVAEIQPR